MAALSLLPGDSLAQLAICASVGKRLTAHQRHLDRPDVLAIYTVRIEADAETAVLVWAILPLGIGLVYDGGSAAYDPWGERLSPTPPAGRRQGAGR